MKYMGSKRFLLLNGLGTRIRRHAKDHKRVVDLFAGSSSVGWFAAEKTGKPVLAVDLQRFSKALASSVLKRTVKIDSTFLRKKWLDKVQHSRTESVYWERASELESKAMFRSQVGKARRLCRKLSRIGPVWNAYGGYYFSPTQALTFDYMLKFLPERGPWRSVCLAATIVAASRCAAAPGHTAQPFQPTGSAGKFLREAWKRDPLACAMEALNEICPKHARHVGKAIVADAIKYAAKLKKTDLVIVDPPYSGVHYSRFYHVLETIARGKRVSVSGVGRYPPIRKRPQSRFSNVGQSEEALKKLLANLATSKATIIFTFPKGKASNGLSGSNLVKMARERFKVYPHTVSNRFSTLGGNNSKNGRAARQRSKELILVMKPRQIHNAQQSK